MTKAELAVRFIEEHPDWSKKKLGEGLHAKYPDLFSSAEAARFTVRTVTGTAGEYQRKTARTTTDRWRGIPAPTKHDYSRVQIDPGKIGLLQDIHLPYYDPEALGIALDYLEGYKPDTLILNGDILDCYHVSSFVKDPLERRMDEEIEVLRDFVALLKTTFPSARIIYKLGNHEERWERYILTKAPELFGIEAFDFENVMNLGIEVIKDKRIIEAGNLHIMHGHEFGRSIFSPVNPARGFFMRAKTNVIGGHYHQPSEHIEQDLGGKIIGAWSTGCLCDLTPKYMPINRWSHGFATVDLDEDGTFEVRNLKIINGRVR